jgi:dihydrolipoamide dehydrogenase
MFERGRVGGSCVNDGCTPSKSFLAAAHGAGRARLAQSLGVHATVNVDFKAVMTLVRSVRDSFTESVEKRLADAGVRLIRADAAFTGKRTVSGAGETVSAPLIVIDTGTSPAAPPLPGLAGAPYLTNKNFFELRERPASMLVIGGGYIGLELGQGMARTGCEVHIVDHNSHVLAREEPDAAGALEKSLEVDGVRLHLNRKITAVEHDTSGFAMKLDDGAVLSGVTLLVAAGRRPNTESLDVASSGIELDKRGTVKIDEQFRTTCEGVYAIGDVAGQPAFTHVSWEDYRRVKAILKGEKRTRSDRVLAYSTYTEPQIARVGMTEDEAREKGFQARAATLPLSRVARAIEWGQENGFYRLVIDAETDKILGATMVGYETAELVHVILAHMEAGSTWQVLDRSVHIHPTYAEGLPSLARLFAT